MAAATAAALLLFDEDPEDAPPLAFEPPVALPDVLSVACADGGR